MPIMPLSEAGHLCLRDLNHLSWQKGLSGGNSHDQSFQGAPSWNIVFVCCPPGAPVRPLLSALHFHINENDVSAHHFKRMSPDTDVLWVGVIYVYSCCYLFVCKCADVTTAVNHSFLVNISFRLLIDMWHFKLIVSEKSFKQNTDTTSNWWKKKMSQIRKSKRIWIPMTIIKCSLNHNPAARAHATLSWLSDCNKQSAASVFCVAQ